MKNTKATQSKALSDHKKIGKTYVPPAKQISTLRLVSFADIALPEFLWLAILNYYFGWHKGADLSLSLAFAASQATGIEQTEFVKKNGKSPKELFSIMSSYGNLTKKEKDKTVSNLKENNQLKFLIEALLPLISWYPRCPLSFILENESTTTSNDGLEMLKEVIQPLYTKTSKEAVAMYANAIYIAGATNKMKFLKGSKFENFAEIEKYPETEESRSIAASVRAMILSGFGTQHFSEDWGKYFWNRGLEISPCK